MYKQLKELVTQYVDVSPESITRDSRFVEDLEFDSLDFIAMIGDIEEHFQIEMDISDLLEITTVGDALHYIEIEKKLWRNTQRKERPPWQDQRKQKERNIYGRI